MVPNEQLTKWQDEIRAIGGTNPLTNFEINTFGQIDLDRSHPGGFSQFVTGGQTLLSNLVRDPLAFSRALASARRIKAKADAIKREFGVETLYLIGGLANFEADGFDLNVPILLWPVSVFFKKDDYELSMDGLPQVNPELIEQLERCYGIKLDPIELLARQNESSDLVPVTVLNYLANLVGSRASLDLRRVLVITNCTTVVSELLKDSELPSNRLIESLVGESTLGLEPIDIPELNLVVDADATQMRIVSRALAGQNFAVETLPGCGYLQTVVNVVAGLVSENKRVLVVAPREQTLDELSDRFASIGLNGLGVRSTSTWVDVVSAISRNEKSTPMSLEAVRSERIEAEREIDSYFDSLNSTDPVLGVSVAMILRELSKLSAMERPALTNARISTEHLLTHLDRQRGLELLDQAFELGEFRLGPQDSAWFQAKFNSPTEIQEAVAKAKTLESEKFPTLVSQILEFTNRVDFKTVDTMEQWGNYLALLVGVRETLDKFIPDVFDRSLTELIAATAPRKGEAKNQMSGGNRRRLKKLAKEYLRPGMGVSDMHASLVAVQNQRELWNHYSNVPKAPQVPSGINEATSAYEQFLGDLEDIQKHLDSESPAPTLKNLELNDLKIKLHSLANDIECLDNFGERSLVTSKLRDCGLGDLARDLGRLHASKQQLALEFEQAWWQSALEAVVERDGSVFGFTPDQIEKSESRFRAALDQHMTVGAKTVSYDTSTRWKFALESYSAEASNLRDLLKTKTATLPLLAATSPKIWPVIAPAVLVSPLNVPHNLSSTEEFDCVVALDASGTTMAENLSALRRSKQIIAFGDEAISAPVGFEVEPRPTRTEDEFDRISLFNQVQKIFGVETLRNSYRKTSTALGELINREFYQNRIQFVPVAEEYQGANLFNLELITEDNRAKTTIEGATESLDAELNHTVELIFNHALWQPQQSLLVASASAVHAERIRSAVKAGLSVRPNLMEFFQSHGRERFEVAALADLTHRIADRVIFSLGFGRTSHGSVLSNFGQLSHRHGRRYLANLLISAREQITLVSCFDAEDIPEDRLSFGAVLVKDLLLATKPVSRAINKDSDPMLVDLSIRLKKLGARVDDSYANQLPLVVSYAKNSAVIEPDWSIPGESRTEKFRIRPGVLTSMGWSYVRVYSFELFSDPQAVALRIAEQLGMQVSRRSLPLFDTDDRAFEDTDLAWGDSPASGDFNSNDSRLRQDKPPHWG